MVGTIGGKGKGKEKAPQQQLPSFVFIFFIQLSSCCQRQAGSTVFNSERTVHPADQSLLLIFTIINNTDC